MAKKDSTKFRAAFSASMRNMMENSQMVSSENALVDESPKVRNSRDSGIIFKVGEDVPWMFLVTPVISKH